MRNLGWLFRKAKVLTHYGVTTGGVSELGGGIKLGPGVIARAPTPFNTCHLGLACRFVVSALGHPRP
ncbi:hypothetical protein ACH4PW_32595 [Streptomyces sp. NPDC017082]|uniref:hypothetical protein n=1 Tax=Streptomyces sp. NPDC017082 TaxID=3364974 RepID=UPI0037A51C23